MSITKHHNEDGKLISPVDANSEKNSHRSSQCSCSQCDSTDCFTQRNKEKCQCAGCDIKNCLTLSNKPSQENKENKSSDLKDTATKKIIREIVTRETIESLKKVTETLYGFDNYDNLEMITERLSKLSNKKVKPTCKTSEASDRSVHEDKCIEKIDSKECCKPTNAPIVKTPSTDVNQPEKEVDNTATKLSAQVMNVPYEDLHESIPSNQDSEHNPLTKLNIFRRIKEIYEACSCKVCECISSKPITVPDEFCKCKPCDCPDCASFRKKIEENIKNTPHSGCPCIRCDRKDCRGIVKNASEPQICDCVQCTENFPKPCNCEPCQCINCKSLNARSPKTVKLAQVDEIVQREICQCSPCECIECKQIYNRTNPTIMCTTSTEMSKYRNCRCENCPIERCQFGEIETCTCEKHRTSMRKSFEKNYNDYDIRTVILDSSSPFQKKESIFKKQNSIALFTSFENSYPYNSGNKTICKCHNCECLVCPDRDKALRCKKETLLHPNIRLIDNVVNLPTAITNACKCTPCECEICSKKDKENSIPIHSKCRCEICDCLNCDNVSIPTYSTGMKKTALPINKPNKNMNCNCNPCECSNCRKLLSCTSQSSVKFYSDEKTVERKMARCLRKVLLLSPSASQFDNTQKTQIESGSSITLSPKKSTEGIFRQDISTCQYIPLNDYTPIDHSSNMGQDNVYHLYENNNKNNSKFRVGFKRNVLFNLNNNPKESTSLTSSQEEHIIKTYNECNQIDLKTLKLASKTRNKLSEPKYKEFNSIHETPVKISSNDSDESVPIFFTSYNENSCSNNFSRNFNINFNTTVPRPIDDDLKYDIASCSRVENRNIYLSKKNEQKMNESRLDDKSLQSSYDNSNYDSIFNHNHDVLRLESHKYTDPFNISATNKNRKNGEPPIRNNSDVDISYERATKVLREARAFSMKLIKMLDSFEKANRELETESLTFQKLHQSLLDINNGEINKTYTTNPRKTTIPYEVIYETKPDVCNGHETTIKENTKNENVPEKEYERFTKKPKEINDLQCTLNPNLLSTGISKANNLNGSIVQTNKREGKSEDTEYSIPQQITIEDIKKHENKTCDKHNSLDSLLKKTKTSHRLVSKSINPTTNYFSQAPCSEVVNTNVINEQRHRLSTVMRKLDSVFGNTTSVDSTIITEDIENKLEDHSEEGDRKQWTIFKKNLFLNAIPSERNRRMFGPPRLEHDIKKAIQTISIQAANRSMSRNVIPRANEALANLRTEVNNLLNMPILQSNSESKQVEVADSNISKSKDKTNLEPKSMSSTVSSQTYNQSKVDKEVYYNSYQITQTQEKNRDALRVSFVGLRRISDHTVLVKWSVQKSPIDIEGFELLVDGRAAQHCGAARRAAVLTCLPAATRVLLSIRAVAPRAPFAPAHSVLYRPRR